MIRIRLARGGVKNKPFYRIIAIEKSRKRNGRALDILGYYNPDKKELKIDKDKLKSWVDKGAQISSPLTKLISKK